MLRKVYKGLGIVLSMLFLGMHLSVAVSAVSNDDAIIRKTLLNAVPTCYMAEESGQPIIKNPIFADPSTQKVGGLILSDMFSTYDDRSILLPNHGYSDGISEIKRNKISCYNSFSWLLNSYGRSFSSEGMGYKPKADERYESYDESECVAFNVNVKGSSPDGKVEYSDGTTTNGICYNLDEAGNILTTEEGVVIHESDNDMMQEISLKNAGSGPYKVSVYPNGEFFYFRLVDSSKTWDGDGIACSADHTTWDEFLGCLKESINSVKQGNGGEYPIVADRDTHVTVLLDSVFSYTKQSTEGASAPSVSASWEFEYNRYYAAGEAQKYITGLGTIDANTFKFSEQDRFNLLNYYAKLGLEDGSGISISISNCHDSVSDLGEGVYGLPNDGKWCELSRWDTVTKKDYNVVDPSTYNSLVTIESYEDVLKQLKTLNYSNVDISGSVFDGHTGGDEGSGGSSSEIDQCHNGAGSLGWIVCPLLTKMVDGATWVYEQILAPFLEVNVALVSRDNGTYNAWGVMLNISNTVLIAYFLVIIFSQLTGIGIDNYGIKKTLPKVIVVAVLINLSFLICQILVDLSNIIGNSAVQLMTNIPVTLPEGSENAAAIAAPGTEWFSIVIYAAAGGMLGVGALALVTAFTSNSGGGVAGILMPLILAILTAFLAVIFFFALLGLRKAGIVLLVVLSPLAIVCYMLPNTKQYFDKWKKAFQGLLLVYPICGLVIGGGQFVSKLIITVSADQMMVLTALVVMVAPFFFVPSLLKGSFKAFGNLGAKVSGFGANLRGKATNAAKNSSPVKRWQESSARGATRRRAGVNKDGSVRNLNKFQRLVRGGTRNVAAARSQYLQDQEKNRRERNLIGAGLNAELAGMKSKVDDQDVINAKAMMVTGAAKTNDGKAVNTSDAKSLGRFHKESLERYRNAKSDNEKRRAMANVKAAQSLLSGTDAGRSEIQNNLEEAVANGNTAGLAEAAGHLQGSYGDLYKAKNRGANALITDLATAERDSNNEISSEAVTGMQNKMSRYAYDAAGTSKYTQESLANADDQALRRMQNALSVKGAVGQEERQNIISTAKNAMKMYDEGKLSVKPEARQYLEQIANMGTSPGDNDNSGRGDTGTDAGSGDDNSVLNVRTPSGTRTPVASTEQVNNVGSGDKLVNSVTPVMQGTSAAGGNDVVNTTVNSGASGGTSVAQGVQTANNAPRATLRPDVQKPVVSAAPSKIIVGNAAENAFNPGRRNGDIKLPSGPRPK